MKSFALKNHLDELKRISVILEEFAMSNGVPPDALFDINLSVDELVTNVILYAFEDDEHHDIYLNLENEDDTVKIEIIDDGKEFNPFEKEDPDISLSIEKRQIGGLGIYFVKQKMSFFDYQRQNGKNHIILRRKF